MSFTTSENRQATVERFVTAPASATKIFARGFGDPSRPSILFIHSWSGSHGIWEMQYTGPLADNYHLVAVDLRGSGYSDRPIDPSAYDGGAMADDLAAVVDAFELRRPAIVAASIGGIVAADYLASHGEDNVAAVVTVGSPFMLGAGEAAELMGPAAGLAFAATSFDFATAYNGLHAFLLASGGPALPEHELHRQAAISMMTAPHARAALLGRQVDHRDTWRRTTIPTLVVTGTDDQVVPASTASLFAGLAPNARLQTVDGAGHILFREQPRLFDDLLTSFLETVA